MGRRLQLLEEATPMLTRVAVLVNRPWRATNAARQHCGRGPHARGTAAAGGGGQSRHLRGGLRRHGPREGRRAAEREYGLLQRPPPAAPGSGAPVSAPDHVVRAALCRGGEPAGPWGGLPGAVPALDGLVQKILHGATPPTCPSSGWTSFRRSSICKRRILGLTLAPMVLFSANAAQVGRDQGRG